MSRLGKQPNWAATILLGLTLGFPFANQSQDTSLSPTISAHTEATSLVAFQAFSPAQKISLSELSVSNPETISNVLADNAPIEKAKQLFKRYVDLGHNFEPAIADLYADDALIQNTRRYPNGQVKVITIPAEKYKALTRDLMPLAKDRGDRNTYSEITFTIEGNKVRIKAKRYSLLKKYFSPISLLVGSASTEDWLIFEEISESRAF